MESRVCNTELDNLPVGPYFLKKQREWARFPECAAYLEVRFLEKNSSTRMGLEGYLSGRLQHSPVPRIYRVYLPREDGVR